MSLFGLPLFIWSGIAGFIMILAAMFTGIRRKPLKVHMRCAYAAIILLAIHILGALGVY